MFTKYVFLVLLLGLSSCTQVVQEPSETQGIQPVVVEEAPSALTFGASDPLLAKATQSAVERWVAATGVNWVYVENNASVTVEFGMPPEGYIGWNDGVSHIVLRETWKQSPELPQLVLHELGHQFRGDHSEKVGVMFYGVGGPQQVNCLTSNDLEWACSAELCTVFQPESCDRNVVTSLE